MRRVVQLCTPAALRVTRMLHCSRVNPRSPVGGSLRTPNRFFVAKSTKRKGMKLNGSGYSWSHISAIKLCKTHHQLICIIYGKKKFSGPTIGKNLLKYGAVRLIHPKLRHEHKQLLYKCIGLLHRCLSNHKLKHL